MSLVVKDCTGEVDMLQTKVSRVPTTILRHEPDSDSKRARLEPKSDGSIQSCSYLRCVQGKVSYGNIEINQKVLHQQTLESGPKVMNFAKGAV